MNMTWETAFMKTFPYGSEVVIEDSEGHFIWGRIKEIKEHGIRVGGILAWSKGQDYGSSEIFLEWKDITFIANDGFPVRELTDMTYEQAVEICEKTNTDKMRKFLSSVIETELKNLEAKLEENIHYCKSCFEEYGTLRAALEDWNLDNKTCTYCSRRGSRRYSLGGGCPFVFEDIRIKDILNLGNNGPEFWGEENEETLILQSVDGAIMHSFDMNHLFELR